MRNFPENDNDQASETTYLLSNDAIRTRNTAEFRRPEPHRVRSLGSTLMHFASILTWTKEVS